MLIRGDNLDVMRRLRASFAGRFRCAYLDPPFNSGRTFREYRDAWPPGAWRDMITSRLEALAPLVADDGAIFAEIDDTQLGELLVSMDRVIGADNRVAVVTVVRSAATGHKAINRGPVNVTDFLLVYAKDRPRWRPHRVWRRRATRDRAYRTWLANPDAPPRAWTFAPLGRVAPKGADLDAFVLANARHVVRFAQPRFDAVSVEARRWIERSRAEPDRVLVLERPGYKPMILRGGNRLLFLEDKVREEGGERFFVEPLTNVWDDVPFQGIAAEGGVRFERNKKPERLIERVLALATSPGDWVIDPFLGSGTTAAAAHKMGRRYVGIEAGPHLDALCVPRLARVVRGEDPTGITRAHGWSGGGGFGLYA